MRNCKCSLFRSSAAAEPSLSWKIGKASEHSAFDSGSGDERFTDHPGFWRYDDGKIRAEIWRSGMLRSIEVKEQDKWIPAAGALSLKLKNLWAGSKTFFSSAEVLESFRRIEKLKDGTIVFAVTAMPRVDLRRTFWGNDRIGEYVTEYRFHPDGTTELYAGLRCPGSEYAPTFSAELQWLGVDKNLCRIQVPADWKKSGKGWLIFSSGIPVSKLGRWQWFSAAVGKNASTVKLDPPDYCREFPFDKIRTLAAAFRRFEYRTENRSKSIWEPTDIRDSDPAEDALRKMDFAWTSARRQIFDDADSLRPHRKQISAMYSISASL